MLNHGAQTEALLAVIEALGLVAAIRGQVAHAARLLGKIESPVERPGYEVRLPASTADSRRRVLDSAARREHFSAQEIERWKAEGRVFTMSMAIAEALKV